ncbi:zf-HC2 domain-containing protein [Candidatus Poribacteria bacterium]|nr:zf-HC2 domain-containing protein [Candidatus Poribacteria bacterium]MYK95630.1 zf-HC2 domain-containing protein [Candidatus Poribacteria bacterium]
MPKCKKSEGQAIDYAAELLPPAEEDPFEQHLKHCADCTEAVESYRAVLELTDEAQEELVLPELALQDIEMNVYKRLAATQQEQTLLARIRAYFTNLGSPFGWYKTAAVSSMAIALIIAVVLVGKPFQPQPTLRLTEAQSADARIEQYRQQGIQRNLEEALITQHLRNDAWETESQLHRMKEQAQGTNWTKVADKQLENLQSRALNSTQQNDLSKN